MSSTSSERLALHRQYLDLHIRLKEMRKSVLDGCKNGPVKGLKNQVSDWRPILTGLMAEAVFDPAFAAAFREQFLFRRRTVLRGVLERARARGELRRHADALDLLVDMVFGVLWYRLLLEHAPLDADIGQQLSAIVVDAVR